MADQVIFILDKMAPLFKQMEQYNVFSSNEIKDIVKKRTSYEYTLKRRVLTVSEYISYLQYEITLEKLCAIRCLKISDDNINNKKNRKLDNNNNDKKQKDILRSLQASFIRHICYIFDRAIRRFPEELSLWTDYIAFLKEKESTALLNAAFGRAIALHPKNEQFWLNAAVHELEYNGNGHAARILLQRSLRSNKTSKKLWLYYFELELWSSTRILERQRILGLDIDNNIIINGAPAVVLRHAIKAIKDIDYACDLHRICSRSSSDLTKQLVIDLLNIYKEEPKLYEYLCDHISDSILKIEINDDGNINKKRKRNNISAIDVIEKCQLAVNECAELLQHAKLYLNELTFLLISSKCIDRISFKINVSIGSITEQYLSIPSKKSRTLNTIDDISLTIRHFYKALHELYEFLLNIDESNSKLDIETIPILCYGAISQHRLWLLLECIPSPSNIQLLSTQSISSMIEFITLISNKLSSLIKNPLNISLNKKNDRTDDETNESKISKMEIVVDSWAAMIDMVLDSITSKNIVDDDSNLILVAKAAICGACTVVNYKSGDRIIKKCLEILSNNQKDIVITTLQNIVTSVNVDSYQRGHWCVKFIRYQIQENGNDMKVSIKPSFDWIQKNVISSLPQLTISTSLLPFYEIVLKSVMNLFRESIKENIKSVYNLELYTFAKNIAECSVKACPNTIIFWKFYEEIERSIGNHELANNIIHRQKKLII